jgi:hypothetical protein
MSHPARSFSETIRRDKLRKWGILQDDKEERLQPLYEYLVSLRRYESSFLIPERIDVAGEIEDLKERVCELERRVGAVRRPTRSDYVYGFFRTDLERKHFGKIVAIDTDSEQIAGIGNTVLEAYNEAKEKTGKNQFDFKRIGHRHIHEV